MRPMRRDRKSGSSLALYGVFLLAIVLLYPAGAAQAQDECMQDNTVITCTGEPKDQSVHVVDLPIDPTDLNPLSDWLLVIVGRKAEAINEGTLKTSGVLPIGALLLGEDNRLVNEEGAVIDSQSGRTDLPAFGAWLINTRRSTGQRSEDGPPLLNLENHGFIEARGGSGWGSGSGDISPESALPVPPNEVWYTSGALLLGHNAQVLNTGTIRAEQLGEGSGEHDRVVGFSSYWGLVPDDWDEAHPNRITNQGAEALIEAEGYQASGLLLRNDPEGELTDDQVYQHELLNKEGTIRALGRMEAIGVHIIGGYTHVDNQGFIAAETEEAGAFAVGVRATGSTLKLKNAAEGEVAAGAEGGGPASSQITAEAVEGLAVGVLVGGLDEWAEDVAVTNGAEGLISATGEVGAGLLLLAHEADLENAGTIRAEGASWALGVGALGDDSELNNFGLIEAEAGQLALGLAAAGSNVQVTNTGLIKARIVPVQVVAMEEGEELPSTVTVGVLLVGEGSGLENEGEIDASGASEAIGVVLLEGSELSFHNVGAVSASGEQARALVVKTDGASPEDDVEEDDVDGDDVGMLAEATSTLANIVNAGTVSATGDSAVGVDLYGNELVFHNEADAHVRAEGKSALGVWMRGTDNTVVNFGMIEAVRQTDEIAVASEGEGADERVAAIALDGDSGHVDNEGTIRGLGDAAIGIDMQGDNGIVHNTGNTGLIEVHGFKAIGIRAAGASGKVENSGTILASGEQSIAVSLRGEESILLNEAEGLIQAQGQEAAGVALQLDDDASSTPVDNRGTISGEGTGVLVYVEGSYAGEIVNSGEISGGEAGVHIAFAFADDDTEVSLDNEEDGVITGTDGLAIGAWDVTDGGTGTGSVSLTNTGEILGNIQLLNDGDHTLVSSGLIEGDILLGAGDDELFSNGGTVRGDIDTGSGDDAVEFAGADLDGNLTTGAGGDAVTITGSTVGGDIHLGDGEDELTLDTLVRIEGAIDGGTGENEEDQLVLVGTGEGQLRGVQNFRTIDIVDGGVWEVGQLSVGEGEQLDVTGGPLTAGTVWLAPDAVLAIDQLVIDNVSIYDAFDYAGFLAGSGTVQGDVIMQGGHISPGEAEGEIAHVTIEGDYVQGSDATYLVDLRPQEDDEEFGQSDRIIVGEGAGRALFEEGSRIEVRATRGYYGPQSSYLILDGELHEDVDEERLASLEISVNSPFLFPTLQDGSLVLILEKDFSGAGKTPNQKSVAKVLSEAPAGRFRSIEEALMFDLGNTAAVGDALDQLSGEIYTSYLGVSEAGLGQFTRLIGRGMDLPISAEGKKLWADAYTHFGEVQSTSGTARFELQQNGVAFGTAREVSEWTRVGFLGGVSRTKVEMPARRSTSKGTGFQLGAYGRYRGRTSSVTGILAFSQGRHDVERDIRVGEYRTTAEGRVKERALGAYAEARLHYTVSGFDLEPMLALTWMDLSRGSVSESGGGEANLRISKTGADLLRGMAGVRLGTKPAGTGVWPEFLFAWVRDFRDIPHEADVSFAQMRNRSFTVEGTKVGRSALVAGVSIEGVGDSGSSWQLGYRGEYRDKRSVHSAMLSYHFPF